MQAPKQRATERTPGERRTLLYLVIFSTLGLVILGALIAYVALGSGGGDGGASGTGPGSLIRTENCVERSYKGLEPEHLTDLEKKVNYNSYPPSSGPHFQTPAPWGIYEEPINQKILVHNLEHGGIIIQYGDVGSDAVGKLRSFYQDDPNGLVVAPNAKVGKNFVLTAWNEPRYEQAGEFEDVDPGRGYVLTCSKFDEDVFAKFRDERRNKAGERFPSVADMTPGT